MGFGYFEFVFDVLDDLSRLEVEQLQLIEALLYFTISYFWQSSFFI